MQPITAVRPLEHRQRRREDLFIVSYYLPMDGLHSIAYTLHRFLGPEYTGRSR